MDRKMNAIVKDVINIIKGASHNTQGVAQKIMEKQSVRHHSKYLM